MRTSSISRNAVVSGGSSGGRLTQARTVTTSVPKRTGLSIGALKRETRAVVLSMPCRTAISAARAVVAHSMPAAIRHTTQRETARLMPCPSGCDRGYRGLRPGRATPGGTASRRRPSARPPRAPPGRDGGFPRDSRSALLSCRGSTASRLAASAKSAALACSRRHRGEAQAHVIGDPDTVLEQCAAQIVLDLALDAVALRRRQTDEEAFGEGVEPIAERARQGRRPRDEIDRADREAAPLELGAIFLR